MGSNVKITVTKKLSASDVYGTDIPCTPSDTFALECPRLNVGDEFIVGEHGDCPKGFCSWAFADIQRDIIHLRYGGSYEWIKDKGTAVSCCTDGLRPVFFKLERID